MRTTIQDVHGNELLVETEDLPERSRARGAVIAIECEDIGGRGTVYLTPIARAELMQALQASIDE